MNWYIQRLKTMNIREILFRVFQQAQYKIKKIDASKPINKPKWGLSSFPMFKIPKLLPVGNETLDIFEHIIDYSKSVNWHLDLSSRKTFAKKYCFDIDIRTDKNGSAKYVWEVNRMLFLPRLAINYSNQVKDSDLELFMSHIKSWKAENPYLIGVNWYSNIEINIRLINWAISWVILDGGKLMSTNPKFNKFVNEEWLPLIFQHCKFSATFPSLFTSANNHLIAEHAGLFVANCIWNFPESKKWIEKSKKGLEREIQNQHTSEGVNREQAAVYIQFITDFFLISYVFGLKSNNNFSKNYLDKLVLIFEYIHAILDVKGNVPKYGDEDNGRLTLLNTNQHDLNFDSILISAAIITKNPKFKLQRLKIDNKNLIFFGENEAKEFDSLEFKNETSSSFFENSGHFIFKKALGKSEIYLHFNAAPLGYLSIAAHGHSDALSLICHLDGYPFLIDSGTYKYHTEKNWRSYFISTSAHNTITINKENQAINGGPLLWTKHYALKILKSEISDNFEEVEASHNGYIDKFQLEHIRNVKFDKLKNIFEIKDTLTNTYTKSKNVEVLMPWHFHPACSIEKSNEGSWIISRPETNRKIILTLDSSLNVKKLYGDTNPIFGWYSKAFYKKEPCTTIKTDNYFLINDKIEIKSVIEII
ncbi:MAG: hypothetical protein CFE21_22480 [Bacteroidetes bacterium B1(2017)]|nr:MAG: hypothetical protein CFE21_22480 [Bacteroidetes bacterium B1(2017)]